MSSPDIVRLKKGITERDHVIGPPSAPVTIVEYGNFECLDCGHAYPVIKEVQRLLGNNLRFAFRHFPTVRTHPHSVRAAEAAEAAGAQEKFWQMYNELFMHQQALEDDHLSRYARRIGLDTGKFDHDMAEHTFLAQIEGDYRRAVFDEHVTGTPTFYINDLLYIGSHEVESLLSRIKEMDSEGHIRLPETSGGIRGLLSRFRPYHNRD